MKYYVNHLDVRRLLALKILPVLHKGLKSPTGGDYSTERNSASDSACSLQAPDLIPLFTGVEPLQNNIYWFLKLLVTEDARKMITES
jgi:hypothetical protein